MPPVLPLEDCPAFFAWKRLGLDLYPWQVETLRAVGYQAHGGKPVANAAANGSGKTALIIAPLVAWFLTRYPLGKVIITSGSWNQLQNQLWPALERFGQRFGWKFTSGNSPCTIRTAKGGKAIGFSTNDAQKAEGWHPTISPDVDPVFIIVDEAKGVPREIFGAFQRCTRLFQLWVSSPGEPDGPFYEAFHRNAGLYWTRKVTSMECPHIPESKREWDREDLGEDHPLYRSMHLAEFTSLDNRVVISPEALTRAFLVQAKADTSGESVGFSDFAAGGDEDTISYRQGNVLKLLDAWRSADTVQSRRRHIDAYRSRLSFDCGQVWGDADGMGNVIIKDMAEEGFPIREFHGGAPAIDPVNYANLISQVWIEGCRLIERGKFHLGPRDGFSSELFEQLTTRRIEWDHKGRLRIESKVDMKKRGVKSPDRADSFLGAAMAGAWLSGAMTEDTAASSYVPDNAFHVPVIRFG